MRNRYGVKVDERETEKEKEGVRERRKKEDRVRGIKRERELGRKSDPLKRKRVIEGQIKKCGEKETFNVNLKVRMHERKKERER